jgi:hypothetical protein
VGEPTFPYSQGFWYLKRYNLNNDAVAWPVHLGGGCPFWSLLTYLRCPNVL